MFCILSSVFFTFVCRIPYSMAAQTGGSFCSLVEALLECVPRILLEQALAFTALLFGHCDQLFSFQVVLWTSKFDLFSPALTPDHAQNEDSESYRFPSQPSCQVLHECGSNTRYVEKHQPQHPHLSIPIVDLKAHLRLMCQEKAQIS